MTSPHAIDRSVKPLPAAVGPQDRWLVVLKHDEARVFRPGSNGTVVEQIRPPPEVDAGRRTYSYSGFSQDQGEPKPHRFFGPIADALKTAGRILIFGSGTAAGTANAGEQFVAWLNVHRPELACRVTSALISDAHRLTDAQWLAKAQDFYALLPVLPASATR